MKQENSPQDHWESADAYERFMGRWSRELAGVFVSWLNVPPSRQWLEVGCGTGALTSRILEEGHPSSLVATDSSDPFIQHNRNAFQDQRVQFLTAAADNLPPRREGYDAVVSSLVLNFVPDPTGALREMRDCTSKDGIVAACVWDYAGEMQFLRWFWDAAVELDPRARPYDEGQRFPICSPSALEGAFEQAGFSRIRVEGLEIDTRFQSFDDYWRPFEGGPGPAPGYLSSLSEQKQQELKSRLKARLPLNEDGSISLVAKAWAARGER